MAGSGFEVPTLAVLKKRVLGDVETRLRDGLVYVRTSVEHVLATVFLGVMLELYGEQASTADNVLPATCSEAMLVLHAADRGLPRTAAVAARVTVVLTGTDGTVVPAGAELQRPGDGAVYLVDAAATVASGAATVTATAAVAGAAGNMADAEPVELAKSVTGLDTVGTVSGEPLTVGTDEEDLEAWRRRIVAHDREPPQGGADVDWRSWVEAVAGVGAAVVEGNSPGPGFVTVYVIAAVAADGTSADLVPSSELVAAVEAALEVRRHVCDTVIVLPVEAVEVDVEASISPDNAATRAAAEAELEAAFVRRAEPGASFWPSWLSEALSAAEGEEHHALTAPSAAVSLTAGQVAVLGTVTWV